MGVDIELFRLMSDTPASDIKFLPYEVLEEMRLVNRWVQWEEQEYLYTDGVFRVVLRQQSFYGKNILAAVCNDQSQPYFMAILQQGAGLPVKNFSSPQVLIDQIELHPLQPTIRHESELSLLTFALGRKDIDRLLAGQKLSVRLTAPGTAFFFGFTFEGRPEKLKEFVSGCIGS